MATRITDDKANFDKLVQGFKFADLKAVIVGVLDESKDIQVIASSQEFGAEIRSKKAIYYLYILLKKFGLINMSPQAWMKKKEVIKIPERSYIRSTMDDSEVQNKMIETMEFYLYRALTAQNTFEEIFTRTGNYLKRMIQARIRSDIRPANHPLTIAMKNSANTLIGKSKKLIKAIEYRIVDK